MQQYKRDQLVKLMNDKYTDSSNKAAAYLTWPDARLRGYLRAHGVEDSLVPTSRPGLLQEVRIRWYEGNNRIEMLIQSIRDAVYAGVENAEAKLSQVSILLSPGRFSMLNKMLMLDFGVARPYSR